LSTGRRESGDGVGGDGARGFAGRRHAAGSRHGFEKIFNFRRASDEIVSPKLELRILDQLDEGDEETPRMRSVDDETLEQHPRDLLLDRL